jgi:hypothetical protein
LQAYKTETTVGEDGSVTVRFLPFAAGKRVEVIVLPAAEEAAPQQQYPLRGTPYRYDDPTEPVAETDWEAAQ